MAAQAAPDATRTPAQQLNIVNSILRESPFDPVLHPDSNRWVERLQAIVANLNSVFVEAATEAVPQDPPHLLARGDGIQIDGHVEVASEHPTEDPGRNPRKLVGGRGRSLMP